MSWSQHFDKLAGSNTAKTSLLTTFQITTSAISLSQFWTTLISELNDRFNSGSSNDVVEFMHLLPSEIINTTSQLQSQDFTNLLQLYGDDLLFVKSFDVELDLWQNKWTSEPQLALTVNTPAKILAHTDYDYFPNIHTLVVIVATLPVTSM